MPNSFNRTPNTGPLNIWSGSQLGGLNNDFLNQNRNYINNQGLIGYGNRESMIRPPQDSMGSIFSMDNLLGKGGSILGALQGFGNLYMGMQQYGMAKKALKQGRDQFNKNYEAQRKTTNTAMEDRQRSRVAASRHAEDVDSYMARNRI